LATLESHTFVLFESPERVLSLLREIGETMGDREVAVCRELTKLHEEVWRGRSSEVLAAAAAKKIQGEFTIVIAPGKADLVEMTDDAIRARYKQLLSEGQSRKDALKKLSKESGRSRNGLYDLLIK
jgi:16S rRNA (cytidine1402-2'-O)-methyltransferase